MPVPSYGGVLGDLTPATITPTGGQPQNMSDVAAAAMGALPGKGGALSGPLRVVIADGLSGAGSAQASAALLNGQVNISSSSAAPFRLPGLADGFTTIGTVEFRNKDAVNAATIYPPVGGQIDALGVNASISVPVGDSIIFQPGTTPGQWWA